MTEWKTYKLGDICIRVCSGGTPKSTEPTYYDGDIPWLNTKEINFNRIYSTERSITQKGLDNSSAKWIDANCVIVAMYGATAAKVAINKIPLTTNQACCNLSIDEKIADYHYVYYWLCANYTELASLANGGAQQNLNAQQIKDFEISLPPLEEQRRIAGILGAIDDKIENNRRINANLELQAQALYKQWFVDTETIGLGDVVKTTSGGTPSRNHPEYYGGKYNWVKSKELNNSFVIETEESITDIGIAKSSAKMLPAKSILIAMYGATVGQYAIISSPMACNQAICALLPNNDYPYTYLYMFIKNRRQELINKAIGSAQQNISQILIKDLKISSDIKRIRDFHKILQPYFEIIERNQIENRTLTTLRDTLLPRLINGEIRINE